MPLRPKTERILYKDAGTLGGRVNGQLVKVKHSKPGPSGFELFWEGRWYSWLYAGLVEEEFGINVHIKKKGNQKGYPSEAVVRAVWRYLVDRYNDGDPNVKNL